MKDQEYLEKFESSVNHTLATFLIGKDAVDNILPDAPDIEDKWEEFCMAYLPDGVREYANYPTVSLGWMMFIGMAMAKMWDEDWLRYSAQKDLYAMLRDKRGYDNMDEYITEDFLKLTPEEAKKVSTLVADSAELTNNMLMHEGFEAGTPEAFNAYVRCLHQLYYFGAAVELKRLGYKMTPLNNN